MSLRRRVLLLALSAFAAGFPGHLRSQTTLPPTPLPELTETTSLLPATRHRSDLPGLADLLGFPPATRAATTTEIERCLKAWAQAAADRTRLLEYARSHEGRPLHAMVVTSPGNLTRLDDIPEGMAKLGDPRHTRDAEAEDLIRRLPAVVWIGATIHGDETEGSDAMLVLLHHLLGAEDPEVTRLLEDLVILIDPVMNPDGRDRFLKMIAEHRGTTPNVDDQSLLHAGYWPWGRGNHYLFDLNRDWLFAVHPETRGRIREVSRWNPVLFVDAHGMGPQESHLFSPPREPINPNVASARRRWGAVFARDQAQAFDRHGLVYYTGEWNEEWYPGYSDSWAAYRGLVGILYEQARIAADGVRRPEGRILSYRESVLHHVLGALANLTTARDHAKDLLRDFRATRSEAVDPAGPYAQRTFAVLPSPNTSRLTAFLDLLRLQGFELRLAPQDLTVPVAVDQLGRRLTDVTLPAHTILLPNRQPLAHLLAAFLEFDPRLPQAAVEDERKSLLLGRGTRIYDATAWNLTQMFGLPALEIPADLSDRTAPYAPPPPPPVNGPDPDAPTVAWVFDGADDACLAAAARLLERGLQVRAALRPFTFAGREFARGSILVTRLDNRSLEGTLRDLVSHTARDVRMPVHAVPTGFGPGDLPDLGGSHFERLEAPRIATFGRDSANVTDYGAIWHTLDHRLAIRHSPLDGDRTGDLARYNVLILPEGLDNAARQLPQLKTWVESGGTLVVIGASTRAFIDPSAGFSRVRPLPDVLDRLPDYELAVLREWQGRVGETIAPTNLWAYEPPRKLSYPWQATGAHPDDKELKKRDAWQSLFMPAGAILAGRIDTNHWLTAGCPEPLPLLAGPGPVLMAADGVDAPIRFGFLSPDPHPPEPATHATPPASAERTPAAGKAPSSGPPGPNPDPPAPVAERLGWAALPPGTRMHLRMSGLLWPEASHRLANTAWVTRESLGRGQVILFASPPAFRGGALGATRVFLNAVVLGPGLGSRPPLRL